MQQGPSYSATSNAAPTYQQNFNSSHQHPNVSNPIPTHANGQPPEQHQPAIGSGRYQLTLTFIDIQYLIFIKSFLTLNSYRHLVCIYLCLAPLNFHEQAQQSPTPSGIQHQSYYPSTGNAASLGVGQINGQTPTSTTTAHNQSIGPVMSQQIDSQFTNASSTQQMNQPQ